MQRFLISLAAFAILSVCAAAASVCEVPPPPVRDIEANSFYIDEHHSVIDPDLHARYVASAKPVNDFTDQIAKYANSHDAEEHRCATRWLAAWADGKALLGEMNSKQAYFVREWLLTQISLNYARVRPDATPADRQRIDGWLNLLAAHVIHHVETTKYTHNNHYYWAGLSVTAAAAVTQDETGLQWGRKVFQSAMGQIQDDGSLPYELGRGQRALHYHLFSATPLVMMASILDMDSPKLDLLVQFCLSGIRNPNTVASRVGVAQIDVKPGSYDWLAVYLRRHASPEASALLAQSKHRSYNKRLGGYLDEANPLEHPRSPL